MKMLRWILIYLAAATWSSSAIFTSASAATITVIDNTEAPPTLSFDGFPAGFPGSSRCQSSTPVNYVELVIDCTFTFAEYGQTVFFDRTIYLFDPGHLLDFAYLSDIFSIDTNGAGTGGPNVNFRFISDSELPILVNDPAQINAEELPTGNTFVFPGAGPSGSDLTVVIFSDADIPEPATVVLLGLGLAGLGLSRRRTLRKC